MQCLQQNSCFSRLQTFWDTIFSMFAQKVSKGTIPCCTNALASCQPCIDTWLQAGPKEKLDSTAVSQPAIYVASLAALERLKQDEGQVCIQACTSLASMLPYCQPHSSLAALTSLPLCQPSVTSICGVYWLHGCAGGFGCCRCGRGPQLGRVHGPHICWGHEVLLYAA